MNEAKRRKLIAFPEGVIKSWEEDDCVNFAIALGRLTNWLLHVDWFTNSNNPRDDEDPSNMIPLRVYIGDHSDNIYDVRGIKKIKQFTQGTISRLIKERTLGNGGVRTRFYSEVAINELPLKVKPDENKILQAQSEIQKNSEFLSAIPVRQQPLIPAHDAAHFTFGRCACYADALHDITGLPTAALQAKRFAPMFSSSSLGYIHSFVLHPDGQAEDSWGIQSVEDIAERFGVKEYQIDLAEHATVSEKLKRNSPDEYQKAYEKAVLLIKAHRN